jgi:hypothetical protein
MAPEGPDSGGPNSEGREQPPESGTDYPCDDCDQPFKNAQGLAGHRRLAHSTSTRTELEARAGELAERETVAKRREAEAARQAEAARRREAEATKREREIAETGPTALGMARCAECGSWFENSGNLHRHTQTIHPIEDKVAQDVGRSRGRVEEVWREAARKQEASPDKSTDWVVSQFWSGTDRRILRALLARNASFRFDKEGK